MPSKETAPGEMTRGQYRFRVVTDGTGLAEALVLRARAFRQFQDADRDRFDADFQHGLVEDTVTSLGVAALRFRIHQDVVAAQSGYTAQFYDLGHLAELAGPYLEIGRLCLRDHAQDASDILRLIWGALTRIVDAHGITLLFGCASFPSADAADWRDSLAVAARSVGAETLAPCASGGAALRLCDGLFDQCDMTSGLRKMPPLLRSYLAMGGWVGPDVVCDPELATLHLFTAVETGRVPPARARLLRAMATDQSGRH